MKILHQSIKNRYILFVSTFIIIILALLFLFQHSINSQISDGHLINVSGRQRMLSQNITKLTYDIGYNNLSGSNTEKIKILDSLLEEWDKQHKYLHLNNTQNWKNHKIDSLLNINESYQNKIFTAGKNIVNSYTLSSIQPNISIISSLERLYLNNTDILVYEYQKVTEEHLKFLRKIVYVFAIIAFIIILIELLYIVIPGLKQLFLRNQKLLDSNKNLAISENKLKSNLLELTKLKSELEKREVFNKAFIDQAPTAIAMFDNDMCYISVSKRWINDFKLEGKAILGRSHYEVFPEIGEGWKNKHKACLKGAIDICNEAPFIREDGSTQWVYWDTRPWYNSEGNIGGIIIHTGDITEAKEKEDARIRVEKILDKTNEIARIGAWEVDLIENKTFWSKVVCEIHGVEEDYIVNIEEGINFYKEGKSRDTIRKVFNEAVTHGTPYDVELEIINNKGDSVWIRSIGQAEIVDDKCVRVFGVFQDISKIKLSQKSLNKALTKLEAIFNSKSVAIVSAGTDGIINQFNRGAEILTGYSASEVIGLERPTLYHLQEELDAFNLDIAKLYNKNPIGFSAQLELSKTNDYDTREWTYKRKDGSLVPVQLTLTSIKDEKGKLIGYLGVSTDISEKKIAQDELLRKNHLLNFAEEITSMGNWEWDITSGQIEISNNLYNIYGIEKGTNVDVNTYLSYIHPDDKEYLIKFYNDIKNNAREGKRINKFTHRIVLKDGTEKTIRVSCEAITNDQGDIIELSGASQDVTAAVAAEKDLNNAHIQLKAIFNSGPIAIVSTDNNGILNHFNHGAELLLGYSASEMIGFKEPEIYHLEEELDNFRIDIATKYGIDPQGFDPYLELAKRNEYDTREWTYKRKDGSTFPVELTLTAIRNEEGNKIGFLGVAFDITERVSSRNEILRKNQILNFAEEITLMGNWQVDVITNTTKWSANLYRIFQLEETTATTLKTYLHYTHPEDKDRVSDHMNLTLTKGIFTDIIHRIQLTDGTIKNVHLLGQVIKDSIGNVIEVIGTCQDVTAQKLTETELLRKNYLLNFAERITQIGNWQWVVASDTLKWSSNLYRIFEYDENIKDLTYDTFFTHVHPEDKEYISEFIKKSFVEKKFSNNFIHRIITGKGTIKTVQFLGEVILNEQGEIIEMMGSCQDITEQKMEENKFRGLLESAPDAMVIVNEKGQIQLINKQSEKLFGYTSEELLDQSVEILIPSRFIGDHSTYRNEFFSSPSIKEMGVENAKELFAKHKDGKEIPIQISLSPLQTEEGILVSAAIRDITVQRLAQKRILDAKQDLEVITKKLIIQNSQLADFAQITSHNLRAPVSNLNSLLGLYVASEDEYDKKILFQKFETVINHLTFTLNTLVKAIKIKSDKSRHTEEILFNDVLKKTTEILSGEILKTNAVIKADFSKVSKINYDKIYLESIFLNLVGNAIKYKSKDRIPNIIIESENLEGKIRLKISDNGLGINLDRHGEKIFGLNKVFHRHPDARGIGLFMTKTQVEAMGGTILVSSKVNEGTTFTIIF
ncbi:MULTISPECIES: PAS domain S-box protein [Winogradskyella]|uniref:PAS domain S-box protein n=1 Tax=Winogradskyella TaxID=286104 RepID=UPI0015C6D3E0|nr:MULTISPECIES: PAS domain S-box protein [Winogradskyella]QXP78936.1 PAS domain S-box protein [Winogradskyella sp. HaHa_3_26]